MPNVENNLNIKINESLIESRTTHAIQDLFLTNKANENSEITIELYPIVTVRNVVDGKIVTNVYKYNEDGRIE